MDELQALMDSGQYFLVLERARHMLESCPEAVVIGGLAAINLGDSAAAFQLLQSVKPLENPALEAERLCQLGLLHQHKGDQEAYHQLARQAVALVQNHSTLYALGQSLPPDQALPVLREALAQTTTGHQEGQVAYALARAHERLGRFRDGASYASLALLRNPDDPVFFLAYASLSLAGLEDTNPHDFLPRLQTLTEHPAFPIRVVALNLVVEVLLAMNRLPEAIDSCQSLLGMVNRDLLPLFTWTAVRVHQLAGQSDVALQLARAALVSQNADPKVLGTGQLSLGLALFPRAEAIPYFDQANLVLSSISAGHALLARAYLAHLQNQPLSEPDTALLEQWSSLSLRMLPELKRPARGLYLRTLGRVELNGPQGQITLRPRGADLLVLLLTQPDGYHWEDLSMAMYGQYRFNALKTELLRLRRSLGGGIASRPWRIEVEVFADFLEIRQRLAQGSILGALSLWRGRFMPGSKSPTLQEIGRGLEENLISTVLSSGNTEALFTLLEHFPEDLALAENLLELLDETDGRYYSVAALVQRLRTGYTTLA